MKYSLTNGTVQASQEDARILILTFSDADYTVLFNSVNIADAVDTTFLAASTKFISDYKGVGMQAILETSALQAQAVVSPTRNNQAAASVTAGTSNVTGAIVALVLILLVLLIILLVLVFRKRAQRKWDVNTLIAADSKSATITGAGEKKTAKSTTDAETSTSMGTT